MFQLLLAQVQNSSSRSSNTRCNLYSNDVSNIRIVRFPIPRTVQFQVPSLVSGPTGRLVLESLFVLDNGGCGVGREKVRVPAQQQPDLTLLMARLAVIATVLPLPGHAERRSIKSEIAQDDIRDRTCFRFRDRHRELHFCQWVNFLRKDCVQTVTMRLIYLQQLRLEKIDGTQST